MSNFHEGPADGRSLLIRRAPHFLRVVIDPAGKVDALDQLDDEPRADETIHVYRLTGDPVRAHVNAGRGNRGWYMLGEYYWVEGPQDHEIRTQAAWRAWCIAAVAPAHRYRSCPECKSPPVTSRGVTKSTKDKWCAQCANGFDCDLWPTTGYKFDSPEAALAAWERGEAFLDAATA